MRRIILTFVVVLLALVGLVSPAAAIQPVPSMGATAYTYDAQVYNAPGNDSFQERGPPTPCDHHTIGYLAVALRSDGGSIRPDVAEPATTTTYTAPTTPLQCARATGMTRGSPAVIGGGLSALQSGQVAADSGVTRVFRVEGPGNARLSIDGAGNVGIKGDQTLFLNFGDEARAQQFLSKRLAQGYEGTTIKSFDVPNSYVAGLRSRAVPESMARGSSVFQVDMSATSGSFGLRSSEFEGLMCAIIPGSAC